MVAGGRAGEKEGGGGGKERRKRLHEEKKKKKKTEGGKSDTTTSLTHLQVLGQFLLRQRRWFGRGDIVDSGVLASNDANIVFLLHNLLLGGTLDNGCDEPATMAVAAADHDGRSCCRWRRQWQMLLLLLPGHQLIRRRTQQLMIDPASACGQHQVVGVQHRLFTQFHVFTSLFAVTFRPSLLLLLHTDAKDAADDVARRTAAPPKSISPSQ